MIISILLEGLSFRTALREAHGSRGSRALLGHVRDVRQSALPTVLLEDAGARIGLCLALLGVTMAGVTGDPRWDGVGAVAVGCLLVMIAGLLAFSAKHT